MKRYEAMTSANQDFPRSYTTLSPSGVPIKIETTSPSAVSTDVSATPEVRGAASGAPAGARGGHRRGPGRAPPRIRDAPVLVRSPAAVAHPCRPNVPSGSGGRRRRHPDTRDAAPVGVAPGKARTRDSANTDRARVPARTGAGPGRAGNRLLRRRQGAAPHAQAAQRSRRCGGALAAGDAPGAGTSVPRQRATGAGARRWGGRRAERPPAEAPSAVPRARGRGHGAHGGAAEPVAAEATRTRNTSAPPTYQENDPDRGIHRRPRQNSAPGDRSVNTNRVTLSVGALANAVEREGLGRTAPGTAARAHVVSREEQDSARSALDDELIGSGPARPTWTSRPRLPRLAARPHQRRNRVLGWLSQEAAPPGARSPRPEACRAYSPCAKATE